MGRIVTISFTPIDAPGGVPRWNRDLHSAFPDREVQHYSWWSLPGSPESLSTSPLPEWDRSKVLSRYLLQKRLVTPDDTVIADGFWLDGLDHLPHAVSVAHGIWSHLTADDVAEGKESENPLHHAVQVSFRRRLMGSGGRIVAVSQFIADQLMRQWGWDVPYINNGVDLDLYRPRATGRNGGLIIHGVNDRSNLNKGGAHIDALIGLIGTTHEIMSLDEAAGAYCEPKEVVLAYADMVIIPSAYEGNSMFCLEALACDVPIIAYNVGLPYSAWTESSAPDGHGARPTPIGWVIDRKKRTAAQTAMVASAYAPLVGSMHDDADGELSPREWVAARASLESFRTKWRSYVEEIEST